MSSNRLKEGKISLDIYTILKQLNMNEQGFNPHQTSISAVPSVAEPQTQNHPQSSFLANEYKIV